MSTHPKPPPQATPPVRAGGPPALEARKRQLLALLLKEEGIEPLRWPILPLPPDLPSYPLSYEQERLWAAGQAGPEGAAESLRLHLLLAGPLRRDILERALSEVVRRHGTLRTTYFAAGGTPVQRVAPAAPVPVPLADLEALPPERRDAEQRRIAAAEAVLPFDLARGPVLRARLLRLAGAGEHALLVTVHPIAADGWSNGVLLRELTELYTALLAGRPPRPSEVPELPVQYVDFADWQRRTLRGEVVEEALGYWRRQLAGSRALDLPADRPLPAGRRAAGATVSASLPADLAAALKERPREEGVTLFTLLAAAWQALLFRYSGFNGFNVGTPAANRYRAELEPLIGRFANTLVLRTDLSGDPPFRELLGRVKKTVADAFAHQQVPFSLVAEAVEPGHGLSRSRGPLFEVMFSFLHAATYGLEEPRKANGDAGPLAFSPLAAERRTASLDLHLSLVESSRGITASLEYRPERFDRSTARRILEHFAELLRGAAAAPEARISELPLLTAPERAQLLVEWNDTAPTAPGTAPDVCLHDLVAEHAERVPDAPAAELAGEVMPYWELHDRAELLAAALHGMGVGPEVRVAVCLPRTLDLPLALLGVLRAGGACVPLDPGHPAERLRSVLEDSGAAVVITQEPLLGRLPETGARRLFLEAGEVRVSLPWSAGSPAPVRPGNLAYLVYNSTRTAVEHRRAVALVRWAAETLPRDRFAAAPVSAAVDAAAVEMLVTLGLGGKVVLDGEAPALLSEAERHQALAGHGGVPPDAAGHCLHEVFQRQAARTPGALAVACDGQVLTYGELARRSQRLARRLAVRGVGPETRVALCAGRRPEMIVGLLGILQAGAACVPVDPAAPARHLADLLADAGAPVVLTLGRFAGRIPGERWREVWTLDDLGGLNGLEEEGSETQMLLPRHGMRGAATSPSNAACVFYAPGDLAGMVVEHRQALACVRGVEERLGLTPGASFALAQPLTADSCHAIVFPALLRGGLLHLIPEERVLDPRQLAEALRGLRVDVSGVPSLDRPLPGAQAYVVDPAGAPVPLGVAGELLLGGSAVPRGYLARPDLTAERLVPDPFGEAPGGRLYRTGGRARFLPDGRVERREDRDPAAPPMPPMSPITPVPRDARDGRPLPLSFGQQRLWILDRLTPGTPLYNVPFALPLAALAAETRREVLAASLGEIVRRHEVLRTTFPEREGEPFQEIHPVIPSSRWPLPLVDLAALPEGTREAEARRLADSAASEPFDLSRGPLLRVRLLRLGTDGEPGHLLVGAFHHIVSDGESRAIFRRELETLYAAFAEGRPSPLPELPVQYADVAVWQRRWLQGEALEREAEHWRQALAGIPPVLELPADRPRPPVRSQRGAVLPVRLAEGLAEEVRAFSRRAGTTVFLTLLAAFQALLGRLSGAVRFAVGTPVASRNRLETEGLIGFFVNTLVLPCDLSGDPPFGGLVARARETARTAYDHQDVPFEALVEALAPERSLAHTPLFQAMLSLQPPGADLGAGTPAGMAPTDLTLTLREGSGPMDGSLNYNTDLFERETVLQFWENLASMLQAAVTDPQRPLSALPLLSGTERLAVTRLPQIALPSTAPEIEHTYVPPGTPTEQKLADLWAGLLGVERVGLHDDFFGRGGHSLLAIRLMAQIRSRFGQEVPLAVLFQQPTLEAQARSLDERWAAAASSSNSTSLGAPPVALEMQPKGTTKTGAKGVKLPFFCVHPVGGGISCYAELARWMGPERPFLGLPAPPSADLKGFAGLEELAAHHLRALREVQPEGPYLLGGWSMGGLLALEMAHQLREAGQRVELLCLFDPSPPRRAGAAPEGEAELALGFARDLAGLYGVRLPADAADLKGQPAREGMEKLFGRWRKAGLVPEDLSFDDLWERFEVYRWNVAAVYRYTPRPYSGTIALFPAEKPRGKGGGGPDLLAAWRPMAASALEVLHVPGDHYTLLREPCVKALAHSLRSRLNRT